MINVELGLLSSYRSSSASSNKKNIELEKSNKFSQIKRRKKNKKTHKNLFRGGKYPNIQNKLHHSLTVRWSLRYSSLVFREDLSFSISRASRVSSFMMMMLYPDDAQNVRKRLIKILNFLYLQLYLVTTSVKDGRFVSLHPATILKISGNWSGRHPMLRKLCFEVSSRLADIAGLTTRTLNLTNNTTLLKVSNSQPCRWVSIRVLTGVANLASNYDCSNPCSFRDMKFLVFFFSNKLEVNFFQNFNKPELLFFFKN